MSDQIEGVGPGGTKNKWSKTRKRWIGATIAAVVSVPFGIWLGAELWPHWKPKVEPASSIAESHAPKTPTLRGDTMTVVSEAPSVLGVGGTDSSVSTNPSTLILMSARPGKNPRQGTADIGTDPENPQTFVAGALLQNGAKLAEIYENRVVLERAGKRATLYVMSAEFVRKSSTNAPSIVSEEDRLKRVAGTTQLATVGGESPAGLIKAPNNDTSGFIRASQVVVDGIVQGFEVTPGADTSKFSSLGLRSGDVITNVDGVPLESEAGVVLLIKSIARGDSRSITVRRGDTLETLLVDGSDTNTAQRSAVGPPLSMN